MRDQRVVIFGMAGQDGPYLREVCERRGARVVGFSRSTEPSCDVSRYDEVERIISSLEPHIVFQLAADSRTSHEALFANHAAISGGALHVLEAMKRHRPEGVVVLAGSGLQFVNTGKPISESDPFEATSPYGAARIYATYLARYYRQTFGMKAKVGYLFHHESPLRSPRHTSMRIARAAARAERGSLERLSIGDPTVEKEWTFAGDTAEALALLALSSEADEACIGSGQAHSIRQWIDACFAHVGIDPQLYLDFEASFVPEYKRLVSDPSVLRGLGFEPTVGFGDLAKMMVERALQDEPPP